MEPLFLSPVEIWTGIALLMIHFLLVVALKVVPKRSQRLLCVNKKTPLGVLVLCKDISAVSIVHHIDVGYLQCECSSAVVF